MTEPVINVYHVLDVKPITLPLNQITTAEDVLINVCKQLNISPLTRHLFGIRIFSKNIFYVSSACFEEKSLNVDLRIRFKVPSFNKLKKLDGNAYNYYFHQARKDVLDNKVPDIVYEKYKRELVGLGITDMYRVMLEKDIPRETVESEYKKYIPKEVLKKHSFFLKNPIRNTLIMLEKSVHDASYVKAEYLRQLDIIAPEYLSETYKAVIDQNNKSYSIILKVTSTKINYALDTKKDEWELVCLIEDLGFISIRNDVRTIEISRKNGIPFYLQFSSIGVMYSFIGLLDGCYRLTCKWTFNICREVYTPSLQKLIAMKCHGPVGGEFSYEKLEAKRNNRLGCFILRESESKYNDYYIDVCLKDGSKPTTFKLEKITGDEFIFNDDLTKYKDVQQLIKAYQDPNGLIYLKECLPPSEYDVSQLLLLKSEYIKGDLLSDSSGLGLLEETSPVCINSKNLQVFKGKEKEGSSRITVVVRSLWKVQKGKKIEVAMKKLKAEHSDRYLKEFLTLAGQWAFLQSTAIVKLFGIAFTNNVSLVMEYLPLGPLDDYLRQKRSIIKEVDLMEAASNLASALWHLSENDIVHGNIRCRKLLVNSHDENSFTVKLTDPGVGVEYASSEVHWIPVECYSNLNFAKISPEADVWSFGTTLWEIFMYGEEFSKVDHTEVMRWYHRGKRLPKPKSCPEEIYSLMRECWDMDPHKRIKPQAIMRDVNQILYQVYNSRKVHSYAKPSLSKQSVIAASNTSLNSIETESTALYGSEGGLLVNSEISSMSNNSKVDWINSQYDPCDWSNLLSFNISTATTSLDSLNSDINSTESVFELDGNYTVVLQGRIGQGFYGEVYKATMESVGDEDVEPKRVAVKKLKTNKISTCLRDFEREINIMKNLRHPNIVEILGVLREEIYLVMEFVPHGSLQSFLKIHRESLQEQQLLKYALDIANGMEYLGKKNIVHRDLATRNILVADENHVKISDFGLAQVIGSNDYYILKTNRELPIKWYAPESLRDGKFSIRSDVWSYGVTLCETFNYGEEPVLSDVDKKDEGQQQVLIAAIERGSRYPCPVNCPKSVYIRIIYPCWNADPHERPDFTKLILDIEDLLHDL